MRTLDTIPNCLCTYGLQVAPPWLSILCVEQISLLPIWMNMTKLGWPLTCGYVRLTRQHITFR